MINKLLFLGDFFYDYQYEEEDIIEIVRWVKEQEISVILNLEAPLSNQGKKVNKRGPNLKQSSLTIDILKKLNVVGVSLANNHIMDYGEEALKETISILDENGIFHTGAGMNKQEALKPMILSVGGEEYYFYSYGWHIEEVRGATIDKAGAALYNRQAIRRQIEEDVEKNRNIVLLMHWGFEHNLLPQPIDVQFAREAIDAGVQLLIGHHPHVMQPYEIYRGHRIYYSLGNFYFASRREGFNKLFDTKIQRENDYGLGIIWDVEQGMYEHLVVCYNRQNKKTEIKDMSIYNLPKLEDYGYMSDKYIRSVRKYKKNINPILTKENCINNVKLLLFSVFIRGFARNIWMFIRGLKKS